MRFLDIDKEYALANKILFSFIAFFLVFPFIVILAENHTHISLLAYAPKCFVEAHTGHPCPTCGLTRSILLLYRGHIRGSLVQNAYGYLLVLILVIQLFLRSIPLLSRRIWIPYVDIAQMVSCGMLWFFIIH